MTIRLVDIADGENLDADPAAGTLTFTGVYAVDEDAGCAVTVPLAHVHADSDEALYQLTGVPRPWTAPS
jgi:hypothetical protein